MSSRITISLVRAFLLGALVACFCGQVLSRDPGVSEAVPVFMSERLIVPPSGNFQRLEQVLGRRIWRALAAGPWQEACHFEARALSRGGSVTGSTPQPEESLPSGTVRRAVCSMTLHAVA